MMKTLLVVFTLTPCIALSMNEHSTTPPLPDTDLIAPASPGAYGTGTVPMQAPGAPARNRIRRRRPASPHHVPQGVAAEINNMPTTRDLRHRQIAADYRNRMASLDFEESQTAEELRAEERIAWRLALDTLRRRHPGVHTLAPQNIFAQATQ